MMQVHGKTPTTIETLTPLLGEIVMVKAISNKKNILIRLLDMLYGIIKYRHKVDYILIDTYSTTSFYYAFLCSRLAKFLNIEYFPFLHGGKLPERLQKSPKLSQLLFSQAKVNISPSIFLQKAFMEAGFPIEYIPNNINIKEYPYKERCDVKADLLYVRSFSKIYNPLMAVRVLQRLKNEFTESKLCMVGPDKGDGSFQETLTLVEKLRLSDSFEQTGRLSKKEWIGLSESYSFFINTTNFDNMPVSVVEAMALGLIVVSTNAGGLAYLIEDGVDGILVDKDDDEEMYAKIRDLLMAPEKCKLMSRNARRKAEQFDWVDVSEKWKKLFSNEDNRKI